MQRCSLRLPCRTRKESIHVKFKIGSFSLQNFAQMLLCAAIPFTPTRCVSIHLPVSCGASTYTRISCKVPGGMRAKKKQSSVKSELECTRLLSSPICRHAKSALYPQTRKCHGSNCCGYTSGKHNASMHSRGSIAKTACETDWESATT